MSSVTETLPIMDRRRMSPALLSLFLHLAAWLPLLVAYQFGWPLAALVFIQGGLMFMLSRWRDLPSWWQGINTLFFPLAWLLSQSEIHPLWYLAAFGLLALTSLGSIQTRVPLYLSSQRAVEAVAARMPQNGRVLDLGCGLGGWLAELGRLRPDLHLSGVEMAPLNWLASRIRLHGKASVRLGSLWQEDLSAYDAVYAYLSPEPMAELWRKVEREMRPGTLFVSNTFVVPGIEPDETVELHDLSRARLLIWRR